MELLSSRLPVVVAVFGCALFAASCKAADEKPGAAAPEHRRMAEVMNQVARARYVPPADGRLSESQVRMYFAAKERGIELRREAVRDRRQAAAGAMAQKVDREGGVRAGEEVGDSATADLRAAQELGFNPKEFAWVQDRILEAQGVEATRALLRKMSAGRDQLIARMEARRDALREPRQKEDAGRQVEEFKRGLAESQPVVSPSVEHNVELIAGYGERLAQLQRLEVSAMLEPEPPAGDLGLGAADSRPSRR